MGAVTPGETLGTLYNIHVGSNKTKQHKVQSRYLHEQSPGGPNENGRKANAPKSKALGTLYNIHVGSNKNKATRS